VIEDVLILAWDQPIIYIAVLLLEMVISLHLKYTTHGFAFTLASGITTYE
jgi:hypothetical protein